MGGEACVIGSWPSAGAAAPRVNPPANVAPLFSSSRRLKRFEPIGLSLADEPQTNRFTRGREYTPVSGKMKSPSRLRKRSQSKRKRERNRDLSVCHLDPMSGYRSVEFRLRFGALSAVRLP